MARQGGEAFAGALQATLDEFGVSPDWLGEYLKAAGHAKRSERRRPMIDLFQELSDSFSGSTY
jgi:hypothetical protein